MKIAMCPSGEGRAGVVETIGMTETAGGYTCTKEGEDFTLGMNDEEEGMMDGWMDGWMNEGRRMEGKKEAET